MAKWPNPLLFPRTVQYPFLQKRWGWGQSSDVFLQLLEDREMHSTLLQDKEASNISSHSLCMCAEDRTLQCLPVPI